MSYRNLKNRYHLPQATQWSSYQEQPFKHSFESPQFENTKQKTNVLPTVDLPIVDSMIKGILLSVLLALITLTVSPVSADYYNDDIYGSGQGASSQKLREANRLRSEIQQLRMLQRRQLAAYPTQNFRIFADLADKAMNPNLLNIGVGYRRYHNEVKLAYAQSDFKDSDIDYNWKQYSLSYLNAPLYSGMLFDTGVAHIETNADNKFSQDKVSVFQYGFSLGYRWRILNSLMLDFMAGLNLNVSPAFQLKDSTNNVLEKRNSLMNPYTLDSDLTLSYEF